MVTNWGWTSYFRDFVYSYNNINIVHLYSLLTGSACLKTLCPERIFMKIIESQRKKGSCYLREIVSWSQLLASNVAVNVAIVF